MEELDRKSREKAARRLAMLEAAQSIFMERGYESVSMDEVALRAEFSKPTLYQYFESKEELLFEVADNLFAQNPIGIEEAKSGGETAILRLRSFAARFYESIRGKPKAAAIMDIALALRAETRRERAGASGERSGVGLAALEARLGALYLGFAKTVEEGKADGSIRPELDARGAAFAVFFLIKGFLGRVSENEEASGGAGILSRDELSLYALDLVIEGMRRRP
jgi:AcrR family transcriptional regulator